MVNPIAKMLRHLLPVALLALAALPAAAQGTSDIVIFIDPDDNILAAVVQESDEMPGVFFVINLPGVADPAQVGNPTALIETHPNKGPWRRTTALAVTPRCRPTAQ
jgi:hypothetical protein